MNGIKKINGGIYRNNSGIPAELRGKDLDKDQVEMYNKGLFSYTVNLVS